MKCHNDIKKTVMTEMFHLNFYKAQIAETFVVMNDKAHKDTESDFMKILSILYNLRLDIDSKMLHPQNKYN